jgi:cysteine dioxygenase
MSISPRQLFDTIDGTQGTLSLEQLVAHMRELAISMDDVRHAVRFDDTRYARNLLHAGRTFHAMLLCWKPGQSSAIHDHRGSMCGVRVMQGECAESSYTFDATGQLSMGKVSHFLPGEVCGSYDADIHQVYANANAEEALITLHIYMPPLQAFGVYSMDSPTVESFTDPFFVPCRGSGI